jgi:ribosomal protein S18 acetylase RimI-like enzyme
VIFRADYNNLEHRQAMQDMIVQLYLTEANYQSRLDFDPDWEERLRELEVTRELRINEATFLASSDGVRGDDVIVGMLRVRPEEFGPTIRERSYLEITELFVYPAWRSRGLAQALVAASVEYAQEIGYREILLFVHNENTNAQAFYDRAGFSMLEQVWRLRLQSQLPG